ncbi:MAG: energy transducer TonB [Terriglobales bacterium]
MAITEIPSRPEPVRGYDLHDAPVLLVQLQDDLARSRLREAFWISLVVHLIVVIGLATSPKWVRFPAPIAIQSAEDILRDKKLTYLDLPRDTQNVDKPPDTDKISDKNRIATRRPALDRKVLDELRDSRPGAPGQPRVQGPPPQPIVPPSPAEVAKGQPGLQTPPLGLRPTSPPQTQARLEPPAATKSVFGLAGASPGEIVQQAARAAAAGRTGGMGFGGADYSSSLGGTPAKIKSDLDIMSDTMGVDFGPYLSRVLHDVRMNWYNLIPEVARAPLMKKGKVAIQFAILKDGRVAGMRLDGGSGDVSLDRAAWGGITASNPFPPLPAEFRGNYLQLRFHFYYNPDRNELQ